MDCGIPFCHTGKLLNGMASGCPINNLIPEWNDLVYRGLWQQALERLLKTNNFPEFTGRVCPAPCEGSCTLGINDPPVTIKNIEYAIIEKGFEEGWIVPEPPAVRTGKKVAVVGSGPSGLACADLLNRAGHSVTVFERADRIGGLLMYGIPNMKLDKQVVQRRVDLMAAEGDQLCDPHRGGQELPGREAAAGIRCRGAVRRRDQAARPARGRPRAEGHPLRHGIPARQHPQPAGRLAGATDAPVTISARGKDVIVIGGGDTGTDCVGTSLRHGCRSLTQFEILERPPLTRQPDNPWPEWPKVFKVDYGQEEAIAVYGQDPRNYCIQTKRFVGDEKGQVKEVHTIQVEWVHGRERAAWPRARSPAPRRSGRRSWCCWRWASSARKTSCWSSWGWSATSAATCAPNSASSPPACPGVFSAGDMRRGQSLVVWAIHEGRGAAREVDRYLMGATEIHG